MVADDRPPIPADIRRRVLVEAGHRCAIPTCRHIEVDIHHIVPWAKCKTHEYDNLIALCPNCHRRADNGKIDRKSLLIYKSNARFVHDKFSQLEMDILFELYQTGAETAHPWPPYMNIMIKRIIESGYVTIRKASATMSFSGIQTSPDYLLITDAGRAFVDELSIKEL